MPQDTFDASDRPLMPPSPEGGQGWWRWGLVVVALVLLIVGAYQGYAWLVSDVARRRAVAEQPDASARPAEPASRPATAPHDTQPPNTSPPAGRSHQTSPAAAEPSAPAVAGGAVNRCMTDGQLTYTNMPCPEGSQAVSGEAPGMDANGVIGSTGEGPSTQVARPSGLSSGGDPGQYQAGCTFMVAEISRLDYEFSQPLPPPVLDHISTRLTQLRQQASAARCALPAKPADEKTSTKSARPPAKVVNEKASD